MLLFRNKKVFRDLKMLQPFSRDHRASNGAPRKSTVGRKYNLQTPLNTQWETGLCFVK